MDVGQILLAAIAGGIGGAVGALIGRRVAASSDPKVAARRQMLSVGLAAALAAGLIPLAAGSGLSDRINVALGVKSRLEVIAVQEAAALTSHPKFKALISGKSPREAHAEGAALAARGIQYLSLPDLQTWARIKVELARRSPALCAQMWKGNIDPRLVVHTLSELPESDLRAWIRVTTGAALLVLEEPAVESPGPEVMREVLEGVLDSLPDREREAARQDMASQSLGDERACELMTLVLERSGQLPSGLQHDFLRALSLG